MTDIFAFALGISRSSPAGAPLDCYFPAPVKNPSAELGRIINDNFKPGVSSVTPEIVRAFASAIAQNVSSAAELSPQHLAALSESAAGLTAVLLEADTPITSTEEAYLKLHLLSHRLALPNTLDLGDIFRHLPNIAWTSEGPVTPDEIAQVQIQARVAGRNLEIFAVDKFPKMTNYVIPSGVRIADASRIRLGAYLGDGTTVMHAGFINFNAGALGPNMVEGRISQGVILGAHSDLGGSSSTMGTLSGGGEIIISIGEHCLIGANAGTGIPLGDRCTIEAGLYITAGTPVSLLDETGTEQILKARELAGGNDLLFIRNGQTGRIECRSNRRAIELNAQLHQHN
jgi:2,3,4,5-tetrahydropyridine-2-carboxylate N-succinyltransferase